MLLVTVALAAFSLACKKTHSGRPDAHVTDSTGTTSPSSVVDSTWAPAPHTKDALSLSTALLVVVTPQDSYVVVRRGMQDYYIRKTGGLLYLDTGEGFKLLEIENRPLEPKGRLRLTQLRWRSDDRDETLRTGMAGQPAQLRPILESSAEYYYSETTWPVGMLGSKVAILARAEGFLGGAHPFTETRAMVVDLATGSIEKAAVPPGEAPSVEGCPGAGIAQFSVEGIGGLEVAVQVFAPAYEYCRYRLAVREHPLSASRHRGKGREGKESSALVKSGVLKLPSGREFPGVIDYRMSEDGDWVVLLGRQLTDAGVARYLSFRKGPLARRRGTSRPLYVWHTGEPVPTAIGRARAILSVQFVGRTTQPLTDLVQRLDALERGPSGPGTR